MSTPCKVADGANSNFSESVKANLTSSEPPAKFTLPFDSANEAAIVAAAYHDAPTRSTLVRRLVADDFQERLHRDAWNVYSEAERRKLVVDLALVEQLGSREVAAYLAELVELRPRVPANVELHVDAVRWDAARMRASRGPIQSFLESLRDPKEDPARVHQLARAVADSLDGHGRSGSGAFTFTTADQLATPPARLPPLCRGLGLIPGRPILLAGYGGTGKTMLAIDLGLAVASGAPEVWGVPLERHGVVRHVDWECGPQMIGTRTIRIARGRGVDLRQLGNAYQVASLPRTYIQKEADPVLRELADGAALVIIDSLAASFRLDASENSPEYRVPLDAMTRVSCETGCVFIVLVHESKASTDTKGRPQVQRVRGSGAITDASGGVLSVTASTDGVLTVSQSRMSQSKAGAPVRLRMTDDGELDSTLGASTKLVVAPVGTGHHDEEDSEVDRFADDAAVQRAKDSILGVLRERGPLGKKEVTRLAKGRTDTKRAALDELIESGAVIQAPGARRGTKVVTLAKEST